MLKASGMKKGKVVCDVGAGVARLSLELALRKSISSKCLVSSIEMSKFDTN